MLAATANDAEKAALAVWAAYFAEPALALELLSEVAPRRAHPSLIWIPLFSDARSMPGFIELVERMGMVDYWREYGYSDFCQPVEQRIKCR